MTSEGRKVLPQDRCLLHNPLPSKIYWFSRGGFLENGGEDVRPVLRQHLPPTLFPSLEGITSRPQKPGWCIIVFAWFSK